MLCLRLPSLKVKSCFGTNIGTCFPLATLIPVYFFYSKLGLVDTWGGLILPSLFNMFGIYMFMNAIKQIPKEIIESARLDKAKNRVIMVKIIIPMILPVIITHLLVTFISNWNEYFWVLMMTNSEKD